VGGWRDVILKEFTPGVARLTLVADPDGLLMEEGILQVLSERGFEVLLFDDPVSFRFIYESKYKPRWKRGEFTGLVVVVQAPDLRCLPYDLWQVGRKLSFSLADIFPHLSYPVVAELDRGELDILYEACRKYCSESLGVNATKDFILRHVFGVAPELIKEPGDLLRVLLRRHYRGQRVPRILDERFIQVLQNEGRFHDWPLDEIVPSREAFFGFLQERWRIFLDRLARADGNDCISEPEVTYGLRYAGPLYIPFDHDDVRPYVDNLFVEGYLVPVFHPAAYRFSGQWVAVGLKKDPVADWRHRFDNLMNLIENSLPQDNARYQEWLAFSRRWAELVVLRFEESVAEVPVEIVEKYEALCHRVDKTFLKWMQQRYGALYNQPAIPPVMVHHIPRYLAHLREKEAHKKLALMVVDGLAFDQWLVMREVFSERWPQFRFREHAVFAWVPTLTPVSRQALFAGKPPLFFPGNLYATDKEPSLWSRFWSDQGLGKDEVAYINVAGDGDLDRVAESISHPKVSVVGLVVRKIDEIMHGMKLGTAGMHNQVRQWTKTGYLGSLLDLLLEEGFMVYLTSDHGNLEAHGCGLPAEGAVADHRGHRARVYSTEVLRKRVKEKFPDAIEWAPNGLPDDYLPLLAGGRQAFLHKGEKAVCHGGISVEEVIVPFICVERVQGRVL
jgi:hypothetical protein